jgi:hypothetical protein
MHQVSPGGRIGKKAWWFTLRYGAAEPVCRSLNTGDIAKLLHFCQSMPKPNSTRDHFFHESESSSSSSSSSSRRTANLMCRHPRKARIIGLPFYGVIYSRSLRARAADTHAREETSIDPIPGAAGNTMATSQEAGRDELSLPGDLQPMPECVQQFISHPGWATREHREPSVLDSE